MRRACVVGAVAGLLVLAPGAGAESATVNGSGDLTKLTASNATKALTVKVFGLKPPCAAQHLKITVLWGTKSAYLAEAGCFPGATWDTGLFYLPTRATPESARAVSCAGFRLRYDAAGKFYRLVLPRSCMGKAPDRIRVRSEGNNYGSMTGGTAGPTRLLRRG